jgi:transcriptional regulator with XRE-family HTH domain
LRLYYFNFGVEMINRNVENNRVFGENLRRERLAQQLSQEKLWALSGITTSQIRKIESGLGNPTLSTMVDLADALGVSIDRLLPPMNYLGSQKAG